MPNRVIKNNILWNILEVVGSSASLFLVYRLVVAKMGVTSLGVWALVLSTTSVARVADLGAVGALSRYVAISKAEKNGLEQAIKYTRSAFTLNFVLYSCLGLLVYYPAWFALSYAANGVQLKQARDLLPISITCLALLSVSGVLSASLVGFGLSGLKSKLTLIGLSLQCLISVSTVGRLGLMGVALGQIATYLTIILGGTVFLRNQAKAARISSSLSLFGFDIRSIKDLLGIGLKIQVLNICSIFFEPMVKFVISNLGGLHILGIYELASRTVQQIRQVVVSPSQNLTPVLSHQYHSAKDMMPSTYSNATALLTSASILTIGGVVIISPLLSILWLGRLDIHYVLFTILLGGAWIANVASVPGYYLGLASGKLKWNIVGAAVTSIFSPTLAVAMFHIAGTVGLTAGISIGIAAGAVITAAMNTRSLRIELFPKSESWWLAVNEAILLPRSIGRKLR